MKKSNIILYGGLAFTIIAGISVAAYFRSITNKIFTTETCAQLPRTSKSVQLQFEKIKISDNINVTLLQGDFELEIDAVEAVVPFVNHHVHDGQLELYLEDGDYQPCPVYINMSCPQLSRLSIGNGSSVICKSKFVTPNIFIETMDGAHAELNLISEKVTAKAVNSSDLQLSGKMTMIDMRASNSARIQASNAIVNRATISLSNSSSAKVNADTIHSASLTNSSSLEYIGQTVLGAMNINNSSSIKMIAASELDLIVD